MGHSRAVDISHLQIFGINTENYFNNKKKEEDMIMLDDRILAIQYDTESRLNLHHDTQY